MKDSYEGNHIKGGIRTKKWKLSQMSNLSDPFFLCGNIYRSNR